MVFRSHSTLFGLSSISAPPSCLDLYTRSFPGSCKHSVSLLPFLRCLAFCLSLDQITLILHAHISTSVCYHDQSNNYMLSVYVWLCWLVRAPPLELLVYSWRMGLPDPQGDILCCTATRGALINFCGTSMYIWHYPPPCHFLYILHIYIHCCYTRAPQIDPDVFWPVYTCYSQINWALLLATYSYFHYHDVLLMLIRNEHLFKGTSGMATPALPGLTFHSQVSGYV